MAYIISTRENGKPIRIYYEDDGAGPSLVFISGWPLNHKMWEYQVTPLREQGYRCVAYDRRGFGQSDPSLTEYSYNALAADLHALLESLNLTNVVLIGFSMAGGEVIRYLTNYGNSRVSKAILVSSTVPLMVQTEHNPEGVPAEMFETFEAQIRADRPAFLATFGRMFYGESLLSHPVSEELMAWTQQMALDASQKATIECMKSFAFTDFSEELRNISIPLLIIHGDSDKTVPIEATSKRAVTLVPNADMKSYEGEPHGLFITAKNRLIEDIISFVQKG